MLAELVRAERRRVERVEDDVLRCDRIVDRAMDRLLGRVLRDDLPRRVRAWFRQVVDRLIQSDEIPYGRRHVPLERIGDAGLAEESADPESQRRLHAQTAWLRANRKNFGLSDWEERLLGAALEGRSNHAAAKSLGMSAWNFRRALERLGRKIRREWALEGEENFPRPEPLYPWCGWSEGLC